MIEITFQTFFNGLLVVLLAVFGYTHKRIGDSNSEIKLSVKELDKEIRDDVKSISRQITALSTLANKSPSEKEVSEMVEKRYQELLINTTKQIADLKSDMKDNNKGLNDKLDTIEGLFRKILIDKATK